jgi:hypothetical protein
MVNKFLLTVCYCVHFVSVSKVPKNLVGEIQNKTDTKAVIIFEWNYDADVMPDNIVLYYLDVSQVRDQLI